MTESEWQSNASRLALQMMSSGVRGVYEAQMPLDMTAALSLGCVCTVAGKARGRSLGEGFDLNELQVGLAAVQWASYTSSQELGCLSLPY